MIQLTRLNGRPFVLNAELIKCIEQTPDTMIHLLNGEQFVVRESMAEVVRRAIEYGRTLRVFRPVDGPDLCAPAHNVPKQGQEV